LKSLLRRFLTVIETNRDQFGDLPNVNYEYLFKDITSNLNIGYQLPQPNFQLHLSSNIHKAPKVKFDIDMAPPIKHRSLGNENASKNDDDYYKMVDNLTHYVRQH
jgi:hypothetical protein